MTRQILAVLALALAAPLAGCGPTTPPASAGSTTPTIVGRIDAVEARYRSAKAFFDVLIAPLVPAAQLDQVHAIDTRFRSAIATARSAGSVVDQLRALREAEAAAATFEGSR